ncbi:condensation domain-containing protein [Streptantibioticus cattleyicolor]|uniref:Non-ribosomal peptide synthetase n=1 Tax=Streptantibioticus cattleyicolor (strain ATCC 35852 / DSM 46488 / JCM 4925 / NBRC 14057 / NRRL 8057) TaxID=1003195 RepID=F8JMJ7_STREN|nr:condensation domain-containing protein [Streptantibioticus cattleyicolor]AEW99320.1 non-ribosomal peptide synthetase [Streptantibioticus cattleyicolor NRRL 8057 = DSM 46488]CCB71641.1 protein of unknown function [Streptantibioticus cattleyicolor NRRL 8057 = DSM 46488]
MPNATPTAERQRLLARLLDQRGVAPRVPGIPRSPRDRSALPLSFAQQRIWFFHRLAPTSAVYNVAGAARMRGPLDEGVLRHCLDEVVRRHEALRTTFHLHQGRPVQRVEPPRPLAVPVHDLRGLPPAERDAAVTRRCEEEVARPFDLENGPMLRPVLLRLADHEHLLLLVQHHIATDGWSLNILLREVGTLYEAAVRGREPRLPELPVQYADYADWQREWLTGETLERQLAYWRERLTGARLLQLPSARPPTAARGWDGGSSSFRIPPETMRRISALADAERATPYMVLLAAYALVLARRSGQDDLVIGAPVANRGRSETEGIVGCFVNTLPLRMDVSGDPAFREVLRQAREVCLGGYAHQEVPFEKIVEEVNPERDASGRTPLIRHMLGLHNMPRPSLDLPGVGIELVGVGTGKARFDLELELSPAPDGGIDGLVWYAVDLFDKADVDRITDALGAVLDAAVAAPDTPVRRLPAVGPRERAALDALSRGTADRPGAREPAAPEPADDAPAVLADGVRWSHRGLRERAGALAARLRALGVAPGDPVLVLQRTSPSAVATLLAVDDCGAVAVAVDPGRPDEEIRSVARRCGARIAVGDRPGDPGVLLPPDTRLVRPDDGVPGARPPKVRDAVARWLARTLDDPSGGAVAVVGPALLESARPFLLWPVAAGRTVVLPERTAPPGSPEWARRTRELVAASGAGVLHTTPSLLATLTDAPDDDRWADRVRHVVCSGEELWPRLIERCHRTLPAAELYVVRRPAGAAGELLVERVPSPAEPTSPTPAHRVRSRTRWQLLDDHGMPVPFGVPGLLHLAGDGTGVADPFRPGRRLWRTGERAVLTPGGELRLLGPADSDATAGRVRAVLLERAEVARAEVTADGDGGCRAYVAPRAVPPGGAEEQEAAFAAAFAGRAPEEDPMLGLAGWSPGRGAEPVAAGEMRAWLEATAARVLGFAPRRVLEVGCRTGALLFRVAPRCAEYWATDPSARSLGHIREDRDRLAGHADRVRLLQRAPHDFSGLPQGAFDVVVLPVLAGYFPGPGYLERVLAAAVRAVRPGGHVLLTDVAHLALLPVRETAGALAQAPPGTTVAALAAGVAARVDERRELAADPRLFAALAGRLPGVAAVTAWARTAGAARELTAYRYDVLLRVGDGPPDGQPWPEADWGAEGLDLAAVGRRLAARPERLVLRDVPDARVAADAALWRRLSGWPPDAPGTVAELTADAPPGVPGADPEALAVLAAEAGYDTDAVATARPGVLDYALRRRTGEDRRRGGPPEALRLTVDAPPTGPLVNDPAAPARAEALLPRLRARLRERLPEAADRVELIAVGRWPLGPDGTVAPELLPLPGTDAGRTGDGPVAPRTETERAVARVWADALGIDRVGVDEDFFALGGHSLLAAEIADRLRDVLDADLPLARLFESPTVAAVARYIDAERANGATAAGPSPASARAPIPRIDRDRYRRRTRT